MRQATLHKTGFVLGDPAHVHTDRSVPSTFNVNGVLRYAVREAY